MSNKYFSTIDEILNNIQNWQITTADDLEQFRIAYLGSKNELKPLMSHIKDIAPEDRKAYGQKVNALKQAAEEKFALFKEKIAEGAAKKQAAEMDLSLPVDLKMGNAHPISQMLEQVIGIFSRLGFVVADGPEIEDDWHNFSALNFPPDHPARDMQDTYFLDKDYALRTHTSSVQVRLMESSRPPIRAIMPGRVYRNETISARSHCQFHQVEGLYVAENVSLADLKQTLYYFAREMYGENTKIRFRPSYFPFTEISAEMDISCFVCDQKGCPVCKHSGWVEILGCGMVDPNVLENCGIDSRIYTGFAFGMGIERALMLKYRIDDIRLFFENDIRFLQQFKAIV
ncbi:MAG: phenylalanine--tRNA ligase subunit alpha [Chitinophagales bacterium]